LFTLATSLYSAKGSIPPPSWNPSVGHEPSEEHVDGLTAHPFWDPSAFPWARDLEIGSESIVQEYEAKIMQDKDNCFAGDSAWQNQVMGKGWSAIRMQRLGQWKNEICRQFPATYSLLQSLSIPFAVRGVCFARQAPFSGVQPHSDGRNFILTAHLGLKVPKGCWIQAGTSSNKREWEEGELIVLDTSFSHSTSNPTSEERHVLIIDFWHPELSPAEVTALTFIYDLRNKFESGGVPIRKPRSYEKARSFLPNWWGGRK
jgi:aspartyl/asparaginyl beta-hydroxylase (cupin superfamily)